MALAVTRVMRLVVRNVDMVMMVMAMMCCC